MAQRSSLRPYLLMTSLLLTSWKTVSGAVVDERATCRDTSPNCEKWAVEGMCRQDPDMQAFMGRRCPFACDTCGARRKREILTARSACEDLDPACEEMAIDGLCFDPNHQAFMEKTCAFACDVCSDRKRRRARAIADLKRGDVAEKRRLTKEGEVEKRGCQDFNSKCEQYAVDGLCNDADVIGLMSKSCPFACDRCKREEEETRSACEDVDPTCEEKATDGLCFDPEYQEYMEKACPFACDVCSGRKKRRARAIAELLVDVKAIDAAAAAAAASGAEKRSVCEDFSPKCEAFASDGFCIDDETSSLMVKTCPFACEGCKRETTDVEAEGERGMEAKKELEAVKEASRKEVEAAMAEEKVRRKRSFASLLSDAASIEEKEEEAERRGEGEEEGEVEKRGCRDYSPKCVHYSQDGLCGNRETSMLMSKTCPFSCGHCRKRELEVEARGTCKDTKSKCEVWAIHGMCKSDPDMEHFMAKTCPFACDMC